MAATQVVAAALQVVLALLTSVASPLVLRLSRAVRPTAALQVALEVLQVALAATASSA